MELFHLLTIILLTVALKICIVEKDGCLSNREALVLDMGGRSLTGNFP